MFLLPNLLIVPRTLSMVAEEVLKLERMHCELSSARRHVNETAKLIALLKCPQVASGDTSGEAKFPQMGVSAEKDGV